MLGERGEERRREKWADSDIWGADGGKQVLGVRKSDASVVRGGRGREKVLLLEGMREAVDVDDVRRILEGLVEKE